MIKKERFKSFSIKDIISMSRIRQIMPIFPKIPMNIFWVKNIKAHHPISIYHKVFSLSNFSFTQNQRLIFRENSNRDDTLRLTLPTLIFQEHAAKRCQSRKLKGCGVKRSSFDSKRSGMLN